MSALYFLIGCSILIAVVFLIAFFWANKTGQHEDTYTPAIRILWEDTLEVPAQASETMESTKKVDEDLHRLNSLDIKNQNNR
jgi:cbb3-type cytochrome oxidase maturation protein